mgnify:CR=1 FL=1
MERKDRASAVRKILRENFGINAYKKPVQKMNREEAGVEMQRFLIRLKMRDKVSELSLDQLFQPINDRFGVKANLGIHSFGKI